VLSTLTIWLRQRDLKPHLKLTARSVRAVTDFGRVSPVMLEIRAGNVGRVPVHLNMCGFALTRSSHEIIKYSDMPLASRLPQTLDPGRSFAYAMEATKIGARGSDGTVRLRPWYTDDVGTTYYGRFRRIDLSDSAGQSADPVAHDGEGEEPA